MSKSASTYTHTYCIAFDTKEMKNCVVAVEIQIRKRIMRGTDSVRIDLSDHPLYPQLQAYVRGNPR